MTSKQPKIIVLVGAPGSGKSTLADKYTKKGYYYISQDLYGKEKHLNYFFDAVERRDDIIVDRMSFSKEQRKRYLEYAKNNGGYKTKVIVLYTPKQICYERGIARTNHPTIKDAQTMAKVLDMFFSKFEFVEKDEADIIEEVYCDLGSKDRVIVCDIDNTLSNTDHRQHFVSGDKKNWKQFFDNMDKDPVHSWCDTLLDRFKGFCPIILCSGRPDSYRKVTEKWLLDNAITYSSLFMRPRSDSRRDDLVKRIILNFELLPRYDILFWLDDRKQVVDAIRAEGVRVLQVDPGEF